MFLFRLILACWMLKMVRKGCRRLAFKLNCANARDVVPPQPSLSAGGASSSRAARSRSVGSGKERAPTLDPTDDEGSEDSDPTYEQV